MAKAIITALAAMALSTFMASAQIDVHSHMIPDSYLKAVGAHGMEMDEGFPIPAWSVGAHLKTAHFKKYKESTADMVKSLKLIDTNPLVSATLSKSAIK